MLGNARVILTSGSNKKLKPAAWALWLIGLGIALPAWPDETVLPTVTVKGEQEGALAPTNGYSVRTSQAASKTDTPLREIDQSVSVVTRQQIEVQSPRTVSEALFYTPGVYTNLGDNTRSDYIVMRGFSGQNTANEWLDGLKLLGDADGFYVPQIDPFFLERLDVVRGPASVLYGQSSPGGLVALTSKRPLSDPLHEVELSTGSYQQRALAMDVTGPLAGRSDLDYRLIMKAQGGNQQESFSKTERYAVAPSLSWRINGQNRLLLQAYLENEPKIGYNGSVPYEGSVVDHDGRRLSVTFDDSSPTDSAYRTVQLYGYQFEHDFNDYWQFRQNFRYQTLKMDSRQTYHGSWNPNNPDELQYGAMAGNTQSNAYSIDNQLQGHFSTAAIKHTLLLGVDAYRITGEVHHQTAPFWYWSNPSAKPYDFGPDHPHNQRITQVGMYAQDQLAWRKWRLNLGIRQDRADMSTTAWTQGITSPSVISSWKGTKVTHRAGVMYLAENGLSPYLNYSEGFDPSGRSAKDGSVLPPQESQQEELGIKYQPNNSSLQLSAALYNLLQKNTVYYDLGSTYSIPIGDVRSQGLELEANTKLNKHLSLLASFTASRIQIGNGKDQGHTPFGSPTRMASLWADYAFDSGIDLGAGVRYVGATWVDNGNTKQLSSNTLADLALRYDLGHMDNRLQGISVRLIAHNLFNRTYVANCYNGTFTCFYGSQRNLMATLDYQW